jgi:hypothetical protein
VTRISAILSTAIFSLAMLASTTAPGQSANPMPKRYPLWNFDEVQGTCRAKGRLQDKEYCGSKMMDKIVADGKLAIPILISQLTDPREPKKPIYDYWGQTTAGDIAYFILNDLFTDSNWTTFNMPGLEALKDDCNGPAETCWRKFVREHGRKFVQDQWLAAWKANKDRVYWDEQARCFRLSAIKQ